MEFRKDQRGPRISWMSGRTFFMKIGSRVGNKVSKENKKYEGEKIRQLSAKEK